MTGPVTPDLGDLARVHREPWLPVDPRRRLAAQVAIGAAVVVWMWLVVVSAQRGAWSLMTPIAAVLPPLLMSPRGTAVSDAGISRRRGVFRRAPEPWRDVVAVEPPGRWREHSIARLADGRVLELVGMAPDDVVRLAAALAGARAEPGGARD